MIPGLGVVSNSSYLACTVPPSVVGRDVVRVVYGGQNSSEGDVFVDRMCGDNRHGFMGELCGDCPEVWCCIRVCSRD